MEYADHLAGQIFDLGYQSRVCETPPAIKITGIKKNPDHMPGDPFAINHYFKRKFERGATSKEVLHTVKHPTIALEQWGGKRLVFVTEDMTVVLNDGGELITVFTRDEYDDGMRNLLTAAGR